ncbi:MAG TPA: hypothetical protein VJ385_09075 [Fibrobacteria bacterium]|nr:hypothetical protein [Fibrobacteria bacterium]
MPKIAFTRNFIAHPPAIDALGINGGIWVMSVLGFDNGNADVKDNRKYPAWSGFDFQPGMNDTLWKTSARNAPIGPEALGKPVTELWNWYSTGVDTGIGMQSGDGKRPTRYNVLPNDSLSFSWKLPKGILTAYFQPALFPREIKLDTSENFPTINDPLVRTVFPQSKALQIGPFKVDSLKYGVSSIYGAPVLVVKDSAQKAVLQPAGKSESNPSVFQNGLSSARSFVLANFGNTARGTGITPVGADSKLTPEDKLTFTKVDSAGLSYVYVPQPGQLDDNLRSLQTNFGIHTTAATSDSIIFGTRKNVSPYWDSATYWYLPASKAFIRADQDSIGRMIGKAAYASLPGTDFLAHLVEKLAVKKGETVTDVAGGTVKTVSPNGFQMRVMDTAKVDTAQFGRVSKGFTFYFGGKSAADQVFLALKGTKEQSMFVAPAGATPQALPDTLDPAGNFVVSIAEVDSAKTFFLGMKYNVKAGIPTNKSTEGLEGATVENFISSRSGKLGILRLSDNFLDSVSQIDTLLANTRILGGKRLKKLDLAPTNPFTISFVINAFGVRTSIEAYAYYGKKWNKMVDSVTTDNLFIGKNFPAETEIVLVVERLEAPETYVTIEPIYDSLAGRLSIVPISRINLKPVTAYCVELQSFGIIGDVATVPCAKQPIGSSTTLPVEANRSYLYRVRYFLDKDSITRAFKPLLPGPSLNARAALPDELATKAPKHWHLIGFPFEAPFYTVMKKGDDGPDPKKFVDSDSLVGVKWDGPVQNFKAVTPIGSVRVKPGDAYLFASSRTFTVGLESITGILSAKPYAVHLDSGWNFVSNPYLSRILKSKIRARKQSSQTFFRLKYDSTTTSKYTWDPDFPALSAYEGYAYYSQKEDSLLFNPFADTASAAAPKSSGAPSPLVQAELKTPWGGSRMRLTADSRETDIPFLSAPGPAAEIRIGGKSGYMIKKVGDLEAIDEPVEIRSSGTGRGAFTLSMPGTHDAVSANAPHWRLFDLTSGKVYDQSSAADLPIVQGSRPFRLVAGSQAFIEEKTQAILAGAPREIGLSQNFPNPFWGKTRVALDWPAWQDGDRQAVLEVLDMRGRSVARMGLRDIRVGRQVVTLDASDWSPGIYLYRLTVVTGEQRARLQKRMLVSP